MAGHVSLLLKPQRVNGTDAWGAEWYPLRCWAGEPSSSIAKPLTQLPWYTPTHHQTIPREYNYNMIFTWISHQTSPIFKVSRAKSAVASWSIDAPRFCNGRAASCDDDPWTYIGPSYPMMAFFHTCSPKRWSTHWWPTIEHIDQGELPSAASRHVGPLTRAQVPARAEGTGHWCCSGVLARSATTRLDRWGREATKRKSSTCFSGESRMLRDVKVFHLVACEHFYSHSLQCALSLLPA